MTFTPATTVAELARTKGEAFVVGVTSGIKISERRDRQRSGMGRHVETIGEKGHRAERRPRDDFADHHHGGQGDDDPCPSFVAGMIRTEEDMPVPPGVD